MTHRGRRLAVFVLSLAVLSGCDAPRVESRRFLDRGAGRFLEEVRLPGTNPAVPIYGSAVSGEKGPVWLASANGLWRYTLGGVWTRFDRVHGLPSEVTRTVAIDASGRPWCGTAEGPAVLDGARWKRVTASDGRPVSAQVWDISHGRKRTWLATDEGLFEVDPAAGKVVGQWSLALRNCPLPRNWVYGVADDGKDGCWAAVWLGGLWHHDGAAWSGYRDPDGKPDADAAPDDGLLSDGCTSCALDSSGAVWVGTNAGVSRFDGKRWKDMLPGPVNRLATARGGATMLVCSPDGLRLFDAGEVRRYWVSEDGSPMGLVSGPGAATARTPGRLETNETFTAAAALPLIFVGTRLGFSLLEVGP